MKTSRLITYSAAVVGVGVVAFVAFAIYSQYRIQSVGLAL